MKNTFWVRECRGHWHVTCEIGDLCLMPNSLIGLYTNKELAEKDCKALNESQMNVEQLIGSCECDPDDQEEDAWELQ